VTILQLFTVHQSSSDTDLKSIAMASTPNLPTNSELRKLIDNANAPIFGIDVHGNVNEWNLKTAEIIGFNQDEAMNEPLVSSFIVPNLRKSVQEVLDKALKDDETSN